MSVKSVLNIFKRSTSTIHIKQVCFKYTHSHYSTNNIHEIQEISTQQIDSSDLIKKHAKNKQPKPLSFQNKFFNFLLENNNQELNELNDIQPSTQEEQQQEQHPNDNNIEKHLKTNINISDNISVKCPENSRFGRIAILGMPNAGKSLLLNRIINHPISAISSKVNTTREIIIGCYTVNNIQMEFIDTPGILPLSLFHPQRDAKQHKLHYDAWSVVYDSDIIILMIDPTKKSQNKNMLIIEQLNTLKDNDNVNIDKLILIINKCDLIWPHKELHDLANEINKKCKFNITFILSAKKWRRISKLKGYLLSHIGSIINKNAIDRYSKKWKYDNNVKTTMNKSDQILECIRSKIYQRTHQEVPYQTHLEMDNLENDVNGKMVVDVIINVNSRSHQKLLNGSAGQHIKRWSTRDLIKRFGKEVVLNLKVKMT